MSVGGCEHSQIALNKFLDDRGQYAWSCLRNLREIVGDASALVVCRLVEHDQAKYALDLEQVAQLAKSANELAAVYGQSRIDRVRDPVDVRADQSQRRSHWRCCSRSLLRHL